MTDVIYCYENEDEEETIKSEVEVLCFSYIEKYGKKPSASIIRSWMDRASLAYYQGLITENGEVSERTNT